MDPWQQVKKRKVEVSANDMLHQFDKIQQVEADNDTIQKSLHQLEEDMITIRGCLEKKRPKITLVDIAAKLDTILAILNRNGYSYDLALKNEQN